jgi:hypothetical protein
MSSNKCPQCGFVNWLDVQACKRCKSPLDKAQKSPVSYQSRPVIPGPVLKPSITQIIKNDYGALLALLLPVAMWGLYMATGYFGFSFGRSGRSTVKAGDAPVFLVAALVATLIGVSFFIWRIRSFQSLFANSEEIIGWIVSVSFVKDRGRVEYTYTVQGQSYVSGNAIHKTRATEALIEGDEVALIVDRANPKRAVIKDLYVVSPQ